jgi:hypothetical protein
MKLYTNIVPVLKGNLMPNIDASGVIHEEDKIECVPEGSIFKVIYIDNLENSIERAGDVVSDVIYDDIPDVEFKFGPAVSRKII